jgi:hypothetical protein
MGVFSTQETKVEKFHAGLKITNTILHTSRWTRPLAMSEEADIQNSL